MSEQNPTAGIATDRDADATSINLVVLRGSVRGEPVTRVLPSASTVVQFDLVTDVVTDGRSSTASVPVAYHDPSPAAIGFLTDGAELVIVGSVRRRFFRVGGVTQSRTEVVVEAVIPARRRKQVAVALGRVVGRLS